MSGGPGSDVVTYQDRTNPVTADLDGEADDGEADEKDQILADVEGLVGGKGNDTLTGADSKDSLAGMDGNDTLDPGKGEDTVRGRHGRRQDHRPATGHRQAHLRRGRRHGDRRRRR